MGRLWRWPLLEKTVRNIELEGGDQPVVIPDYGSSQSKRDGNTEALATKHALFFRAIFVPSLAVSLTNAHDPEQRRLFAECFENGLKRRLAKQPAPLHSFVQILVVTKGASGPSAHMNKDDDPCGPSPGWMKGSG